MSALRLFASAVVGTSLVTGAARAQGGVRSTMSALAPNAVAAVAAVAGSISVTINGGAVQSLASVTDGIANAFPSPVSISVTWDLHPSTASVAVVGYFTNAAAAMTSGPVSVPSSWVKGRVLTADVTGAPTTFTAFTQTGAGGVGAAGASLSLFTQPVLGYSRTGTTTIDLELQLDLVGRVLTPGTYTGTLNIRAVSQ